MLEEFKKFAVSGNVLDLAVGVIIGAAFGKITSSLVEDILNPIIGLILPTGDLATATLKIGENAVLKYGNFLNNIIQFVIVAWVLFLIVKAANKLKEKQS
ncbi:MAG: large conductance mechanosensitive channel protein MscL [Spirosomaceae bacterium]|jgi:large conductance mechanosensitive channel|nr:large conductance mechanosensitive channel protein MscL [Spirosomataceae bacterium]